MEDSSPFTVYRVNLNNELADLVSLLPPSETIHGGGLPIEGILGKCKRLMADNESLTEENLIPNKVFVDLLHEVIATFAPQNPDFQAEVRRQGDGWVYIIDARTQTPEDAVPPQDIIGAFQVTGGQLVPGSYSPSPKHSLLTSRGLFQLGPALHARLLETIRQRSAERLRNP